MNKVLTTIAVTALLATGCTSVPMESKEKSELAKKYNSPSDAKAGLYVYRSGSFGGALKKDVWLDGKCVGETAPNMFFYEEIEGNAEHKVSTESEFSANDLLVKTESGKNYFVSQYIKMGVFVGGSGVDSLMKKKVENKFRNLIWP